ncbi:MAG: TspO/MBR family protein [Chitinophagales bacterium]
MKQTIFFPTIVFSGICLMLGIASSFSTVDQIRDWYPLISKPSWTPPSWIFGPVWTVLYILMGFSLALIYSVKSNDAKYAIWFFIFHFLLNLSWSIIFFKFHLIGVACFVIMMMVLSLIILMFLFFNIRKLACYVLIPYLLWLFVALAINSAVWIMN